MEISACPVCGTMDIRFETTDVVSHKVVNWRSGEKRPVFVASEDVIDSLPPSALYVSTVTLTLTASVSTSSRADSDERSTSLSRIIRPPRGV